MPAECALPEDIQSLLDQADLSLLRGKHGEASTFFWKATEAAIKQAALGAWAQAGGHPSYDDVEPFIDSLERKTSPPGVGI